MYTLHGMELEVWYVIFYIILITVVDNSALAGISPMILGNSQNLLDYLISPMLLLVVTFVSVSYILGVRPAPVAYHTYIYGYNYPF